ncbi:dynamin superfamily protein, partial [Kipferlia bialata]
GKKSIGAALKDEQDYFLAHPAYSGMVKQLGNVYLARMLNQVLVNHIRSTLPALRQKVQELLLRYRRELGTLGSGPIDQQGRSSMVLQLLSNYAKDYANMIDGRSSSSSRSELVGGARISYIFFEVLPRMLDTVDPAEIISSDEIRTVVRNATGPNPSLFIPEHAFELFVTKVLKRLEAPCIRCLELVLTELGRIAKHVPSREIRRYKQLTQESVLLAIQMLRDLADPCKKYISDTIQCELSFINTLHPDFCGSMGAMEAVAGRAEESSGTGTGAEAIPSDKKKGSKSSKKGEEEHQTAKAPPNMAQLYSQIGARGTAASPVAGPGQRRIDEVPERLKASGPMTGSETIACEIIPELLKSYYAVVKRKTQDTIIKCVMHFLVNESKRSLQQALIAQLYKENKLE